ncbi:MAG: cadherin-like beta sandwich domain-containing protein [Gammaproteobacteria bacterium]|nr:cadherin-like beta sandwich domain-containing protein [Gammaproteobacteria bacterium]
MRTSVGPRLVRLALLVSVVVFGLAACGGGSGGKEKKNVAPVISNLQLGRDTVPYNEGGGTFILQAFLDYTDPEGDIRSVIIEISGGSRISLAVPQPIPTPSGTLEGVIELATSESGQYSGQVWVVDGAGNSSNRLDFVFTILGSAELTGLSLVEAPFTQPFDPSRFIYHATVTSDVAQVFVTAQLLDENSTIDVNGISGTSGTQVGPVEVDFGSNEIAISIAAAYGDDTSEYRIFVERELSSNARLASLSVTPGALDQVFDPAVADYTAVLSFLTQNVHVVAETEDDYATIQVNGSSVPSGVSSGPIKVFMEDASRLIDITVIAQDGIARENYQISAVRQKPAPFATFETIADDLTVWPGTTDLLNGFRTPSYDGSSVAFLGIKTGQGAIFVASGSNLDIIADITTSEPRSAVATFEVFGDPAVDGDAVAFHSFAPTFGGIYSSIGGNLAFVADDQTDVPGGTGTFWRFSDPAFNAGNTAFLGAGFNSQQGVYSDLGGTLDVVVDKTTVSPNAAGALFELFGEPHLADSNIVFLGMTAPLIQEGIYRFVGGNLEVIADRSTIFPGSLPTMQHFDAAVDQSDGSVAFFGKDSFGWGHLFVHDGIGPRLIADPDTAIPMTGSTLRTPSPPVTMDGQALVFTGFAGPVLVRDGTMSSLAGAGDVIGGKVLRSASFRHDSLSGDKIALLLAYTDLTSSVVLADLSVETPMAIAAYELQGDYSDVQGGPDLVPLGGALQGNGYAFGQNQGLTSTGVLTVNEYSIEIVFRLDDIAGLRKLVDFGELGSDTGLYLDDGVMTFIDTDTPQTLTSSKIAAEEAINIHMVLSRSAATGEVTVSVDGVEHLRFIDAGAQATFATSSATFFRDDDVTQTQASSGFAHFVRTYDSALSAQQVRFLARSLSDCALDGCLDR